MDEILIKYGIADQSKIELRSSVSEIKSCMLNNSCKFNNNLHFNPNTQYQCEFNENNFRFEKNLDVFDLNEAKYHVVGSIRPNGQLNIIDYNIIPSAETILIMLSGAALSILGIIGCLLFGDYKSLLLTIAGAICVYWGKYYLNKTNETAKNEFKEFISQTMKNNYH